MTRHQPFTSHIVWTGNRGQGTRTYRGSDRTWEIRTPGKPAIACSNDPALGGDPARPNPEDLLLSSVAACHMLWYLHLASDARITVVGYDDTPVGAGETASNGAGQFLSAILRPHIRVLAGADLAVADSLHHEVSKYCFIARSVNFPIRYEATYEMVPADPVSRS